MRKLLLILPVAAACAGAGCGDDGGGDGPAAATCFDYARFDGTTPAVDFRAEVLPLFQRSCTFSATCHGDAGRSAGFTYLGPSFSAQATEEQVDEIVAQNVGVPSKAPSGMPRIAAGDPANSFLLHKVDGTLRCAALECAPDQQCGDPMPQGGELLPAAERDVIRRWIRQGAGVP